MRFLARIWKAQNSPRLLPWIYSVLRRKYAEPSKFTVFKIHCEGAKKLQQKISFCGGAKKLQQKISICEGAKKFQYRNFELNKILIQNEARERVKDTLPQKFQLLLQSVLTKSQ